MAAIHVVMTATGLQPQDPAVLEAQIIATATALSPGLTANLPASLIEDVASTSAGAGILCDQACVESINNVTPLGANVFVLNNLGKVYGVQQGVGSNASVYCVFTGTVGFVIPRGFTVSDGSNQYTVQDGGIVQSGGDSGPLFCVATAAGDFAIPANTVTTLITSIPGAITLTVNNPSAGTSSTAPQSVAEYRAQVLQAGQSIAQGMTTYLRKQIQSVPGVQSRLVSARAYSTGWEIIVGGNGDPYAIAQAIFIALFNINTLLASTRGSVAITGITQADPGVINVPSHTFTNGEQVNIAGVVGMTAINGGPYPVTVVDANHISVSVDTTAFTPWSSGGAVTNTATNQTVTINDYPDSYNVPFVVPALQNVIIGLTWNTTAANYVSDAAVASLGSPAIISYINSIPVGQPINVFELQNAFQLATVDLIPTAQLTRMVFAIQINGVSVSPAAGTEIIQGASEGYLYTSAANVSIVRG